MELNPGDFVVDKTYLLTLLSEQFKGETLKLKHRTGHLWNRLCDMRETVFTPVCPMCEDDKMSRHHWMRHNDTMQFSARDVLSNHDAFLAWYRYRVGDAAKEDFKLLCDAIERQLNQG